MLTPKKRRIKIDSPRLAAPWRFRNRKARQTAKAKKIVDSEANVSVLEAFLSETRGVKNRHKRLAMLCQLNTKVDRAFHYWIALANLRDRLQRRL